MRLRFATISIRGDGRQLPLPSMSPIGTGTSSPSDVLTHTDTARLDSSPRRLRAKKRSVGSARPAHTGGLVALLPAGRRSECPSPASRTRHGSLPATTLAPRRGLQPVAVVDALVAVVSEPAWQLTLGDAAPAAVPAVDPPRLPAA